MGHDDISLLEQYLLDSKLLESELKKNQGIQNIHKTFAETSKPPSQEPLKWTPMDAVEVTYGLVSYIAPQLKLFLSAEVCQKWGYCKKRNSFNSQLALAVALFTYFSESSTIASEISKTMPIVLCVATLVQTNFLNEHCGC